MTGSNPAQYPPIKTILVIDDDENWCFISKRLLSQANACSTILTAKNGLIGIQKLQELAAKNEQMPALIFLDIKMPVMDGFGFLSTLQTTPQLDMSQTKIYICSSSLHPKDKEQAERHTIAGFITKPLTDQSIREILSNHAASAQAS